jgi:hypothetical protein
VQQETIREVFAAWEVRQPLQAIGIGGALSDWRRQAP